LPKKTAAVIVNSKNDYLIGVKKNQRRLFSQSELIMADKNNHSSSYTTLEINKGRTELRHIVTSNSIEVISKDWKGLQQVVAVYRKVKDNGKQREETAYFISSQNGNAFLYEEGIRSHWQIENSLHWVKDVTLKEDASKIRMGNAPQNISTIKNIGINLFRANHYNNIAQAIRLVANDIATLYTIIT
jgi:predicted transposase YbfD/YdcC